MKTIMILGASALQVPAILKAKEMGHKVIAVDMDPEAVGFEIDGVIKEVISTIDTENILIAAKKHNIDGITTICTDLPMRSVAHVAHELGLPGISEEAAFTATDKGKMRECMLKNGVPTPRFVNVKTKEEYDSAIVTFDKRCVVKAPDNSGSRGIDLISNVNDKEETDKAFEYCMTSSRCGELVIEEFMEGPEVCVETLNVDGMCYPIQITDQLHKQPPYFTDAGYNQPSLLDEDTKKKIKEVAIAANLAIGNGCGSSCTEIIVTKEGPKIVEIGPRLAGDYMTTDLVPLSTGVDMVKAVINIALGDPVDMEPKYDKGSCIRYYMKPTVGIIKEFKGLDEASAIKGVQRVTMLKKIGDMAVELHGSGDRLGYVLVQADSAEEAVKLCDEALSKIEVITE